MAVPSSSDYLEFTPPTLHAEKTAHEVKLIFSGDWILTQGGLPDTDDFQEYLKASKTVIFDLSRLQKWDTALVAFLFRLARLSLQSNYRWKSVPSGVETLLELALRQPAEPTNEQIEKTDFLERAGITALAIRAASERIAVFIGEMTLSASRFIRHQAYFRPIDFLEALVDAGPRALPIVTLISFLVGLILAYVGSMQLQQFGAQIFVANLVGVAMTREMGAMMTGIIMAGRTGASYAARLGTMQVNEEIDALRTNGMEPLDFLALPRIMALLLMVPFLCIYADAVGILGGAAIGVGVLDLSPIEYWNQTVKATKLADCWAGLIKSIVFALVVGLAGCYHGLRCGRSSEAVGRVTTTAVVSAIVFIILTDALLTVVYDVLGF